jgi:hypothetical protein
MSIDGGLTWNVMRMYDYDYQFGDFGSITLLGSTHTPISQILFSVDQGKNFIPCSFPSNDPITISDILPGSSVASTSFIVYGTRDNDTGVLVALDFSKVFPRQCSSPQTAGTNTSDFELWYPHTPDSPCVLGQTEALVRKKSDALCYYGEDYKITKSVTSCPCTRDDFECNTCFIPNKKNECVLDTNSCPQAPKPNVTAPVNCSDKDGFYVNNAYRLIEGDQCDLKKGLDLRDHFDCPDQATKLNTILLVSCFVLVAVGVLTGVFVTVYFKNQQLREYFREKFPSLFKTEKDHDYDYDSLLTNDMFDEAVEDEIFDKDDFLNGDDKNNANEQ